MKFINSEKIKEKEKKFIDTINAALDWDAIGKMLMEKAEEITRENNKSKIVVISGVGVRQYYKKIGYSDDGPYVSKELN